MCVCVRMDRIVEINLVQSDWLCWLKLKQAGVCVCVCVWSTVARAEERGKEESTGLAVTANTATAAHLTPRSFTHRHRQRGDTTVRKNRLIFCQ